jgi:hypothetical protein
MSEIIGNKVAGGLGFEPRQSESESEGLPLADPPSYCLSALVIAFVALSRKALERFGFSWKSQKRPELLFSINFSDF